MAQDDFEYIDTQEVPANGLQIYQQDKAFIDMQIATAKQYPRNLKRAISNATTLVTLNEEIAKSCTYTLKKGGKSIVGPSVYLARILAREMGNMRVENRVVGFDKEHVTVEAVCFDLEKNYAVRTQIKKSIVGNSGMFSEDMKVIVANAANAIAFRNAVFAVVSREVTDEVWNASKEKMTGNISDKTSLTSRVNKIVAGFKSNYPYLNLKDEEIARAVGKESIDHITKEDTIVLIGLENSFKAGDQKPEEVFRGTIAKPPVVHADKSSHRMMELIKNAKTQKDLEKLQNDLPDNECRIAYDLKWKSLK